MDIVTGHCLAGALFDVASEIMDGSVERDTWMMLGLKMLIQAEDILDMNRRDPWRLPTRDATVLTNALSNFVDLNVALRAHFLDHIVGGKLVLLFHMTVKFHYLLHIAHRREFENHRMSWCYSGESLMAVLRELVVSWCKGVDPAYVANKIMQTCSHGLSLALSLCRTR